jgi:regulatory protein
MPADSARTITQLAVQSRNSDRVSVFVNGEFAFGVHQAVAAKNGLAEGQPLSPEQEEAIQADESLMQAKQHALTYLAHKPRTEQEVRQKLAQREVAPPIIDPVVERMKELGYVDDAAYAADYVRNRFASKQYGPQRLIRELVQRGIDRNRAESAVAAFFEAHDTLEAARAHAKKRWPRIAGDDDPRRQKQKLYRYLMRRGFASDTVYRVIDEIVPG